MAGLWFPTQFCSYWPFGSLQKADDPDVTGHSFLELMSIHQTTRLCFSSQITSQSIGKLKCAVFPLQTFQASALYLVHAGILVSSWLRLKAHFAFWLFTTISSLGYFHILMENKLLFYYKLLFSPKLASSLSILLMYYDLLTFYSFW